MIWIQDKGEHFNPICHESTCLDALMLHTWVVGLWKKNRAKFNSTSFWTGSGKRWFAYKKNSSKIQKKKTWWLFL